MREVVPRRGEASPENRGLCSSHLKCVCGTGLRERESLASLSHLLQLLGGCLAHVLFPVPACASQNSTWASLNARDGKFSPGDRDEHPHVPQCPPGPHTVWTCVAWLRWVKGSGPHTLPLLPSAGISVPAGAPELSAQSLCCTPSLTVLLALQRGQLEKA